MQRIQIGCSKFAELQGGIGIKMANDHIAGKLIQEVFDKMSVNCRFCEKTNEKKECLYYGRTGSKPCVYKTCQVLYKKKSWEV